MAERSSFVWKWFTKLDNDTKVKCNVCHKIYSFCGSTSSFSKHLNKEHGSVISQPAESSSSMARYITKKNRKRKSSELSNSEEEDDPDPKVIEDDVDISQSSSQNEKSADSVKFHQPKITTSFYAQSAITKRQDRITDALANMIATDLLPFSFVEGSGFKNFMKIVDPNYKIPLRSAIGNRVNLLYDLKKKKVREEMTIENTEHVSLTTDTWTSRNNTAFLTVTAHSISNDWQMKNVTLDTVPMKEAHTAKNLAKKMQGIVNDFHLQDRIVATTHDNAHNITKAISDNKDLFGASIRCLAHSIQLCLNEGLKKIGVINKCSSLVGHFKHSYKASDALNDYQKKLEIPQHKLIQLVPTRWNSSYLMMERITEQRTAIVGVLNDRNYTSKNSSKKYKLEDGEWDLIQQLVKILKPFELATKVISSESYPTASFTIPLIKTIEKFISVEVDPIDTNESDNDDDNLKIINDFKICVKAGFQNRFPMFFKKNVNCVSLFASTFLDPRYKNNVQDITELLEEIRLEFETLASLKKPAEPKPNEKKSALQLLFPDDSESKLSEVDRYLKEAEIPKEQDVLEWWKCHKERYPILSSLAKKYLCISATSVPSERVFSSAGNIITSKRSSLSANKAKKLVFLYQNSK